MIATYVDPTETPISLTEAAKGMRWALAGQLKCPESLVHESILALALAKVWLETGRGLHCWNYNWGNVKCSATYAGNFTCICLNEVLDGKLVWFAPEGELTASPSKGGKLKGTPLPVPDGHPQTRMRALANHYDGVVSYVDFVVTHYRAAWDHLLCGSPVGYVHALKAAHYFTADEELYLHGVVALRDEILARLRGMPPAPAKDLQWERLIEAVPRMQFDLAALAETPNGFDFPEVTA